MNSMYKRITASLIGAAMAVSVFSACDGAKKSGVEANLLDALDAGRKQIVEMLDNTQNGSSQSELGQKVEIALKPGKNIKSALGLNANEISLLTENYIDGSLTEDIVKLNLDDKTIASANLIGDLSNGDSYIKIDGLSDKYLKLESSDLYTADDYFESLMPESSLTSDFIKVTPAIDDDTSADSYDTQENGLEAIGEIIKNVDIKGVVTDIKGVINTAAESLPKAYSESSRTVSANGISAKFDVKRIKISGDDIEKVVNSAEEAIEKADCLKKAISSFADWDEFKDDIFGDLSSSVFESLNNVDIALYYYGDEIVGFGFDKSSYLVCSDTSDGFMFAFNDKPDCVKINLTAVPDGDDVDIELNVDFPNKAFLVFSDYTPSGILTPKSRISMKLDGMKLNPNDGSFDSEFELSIPATIDFDGFSGGSSVFDIGVDIKGDEHKLELKGDVTVSGDGFNEKLFDFSIMSEETKASAVTLPENSECIPASEAENVFSKENINAWLDGITEALGVDFAALMDNYMSDYSDYDYLDDPLYDLSENYGIDYYDYYNDSMTEFDMDKFLKDAEKAGYPDMDALKETIEERYGWPITTTPNLSKLASDYDIDYYDYYNDSMTEFDMDKFLKDAEKAGYPDMDGLKKEIEEEYEYSLTDTPNLSILYNEYGIDYSDYYDDYYTEFDMDGFLEDAQKAGYPDLKALKKEVEECIEYEISQTPNMDALGKDYGIYLYEYIDEDTFDFDTDKYLKDAEKAGYPDMDALREEIDEYYDYDYLDF